MSICVFEADFAELRRKATSLANGDTSSPSLASSLPSRSLLPRESLPLALSSLGSPLSFPTWMAAVSPRYLTTKVSFSSHLP